MKHLLRNREGGIFVQLSLYVITYSYSFSSVATSIVPSAIVPILCVFAVGPKLNYLIDVGVVFHRGCPLRTRSFQLH